MATKSSRENRQFRQAEYNRTYRQRLAQQGVPTRAQVADALLRAYVDGKIRKGDWTPSAAWMTELENAGFGDGVSRDVVEGLIQREYLRRSQC